MARCQHCGAIDRTAEEEDRRAEMEAKRDFDLQAKVTQLTEERDRLYGIAQAYSREHAIEADEDCCSCAVCDEVRATHQEVRGG